MKSTTILAFLAFAITTFASPVDIPIPCPRNCPVGPQGKCKKECKATATNPTRVKCKCTCKPKTTKISH
ncbi:Ornithine aminotransferase [Venturia inaequalis]|nr:Ornithine aminotransferase [Venturia inaequalis]